MRTRRTRTRTRTRLRPACDALIAVAALLTVLAARWPWFTATLVPTDANVGGPVMAPEGTVTGLYAHRFVWVAVGVAVGQLVLLLLRYYPGGRLRVPGDGSLLAVGALVGCLTVVAGVGLVPGPWDGLLNFGEPISVTLPFSWESASFPLDGFTLVISWRYGAMVALAAGLASVPLTMAALRLGRSAQQGRLPRGGRLGQGAGVEATDRSKYFF